MSQAKRILEKSISPKRCMRLIFTGSMIGLGAVSTASVFAAAVRMHPAYYMIGNTKLPGIIKDDDGVAQKPMLADVAPDASFTCNADQPGVEDIDAALRQML